MQACSVRHSTACTRLLMRVLGAVVCRFFLKRAPFAVPGGELKVETVRPAYQVG